MRIGLYLGRHAGQGGGIAVYARSLVQHLVELLSQAEFEHVELVLYGESTVLDAELLSELSLAEVLVSEARGSMYRGASSYFRKLPNGARSRVLVRPLGEALGRQLSSVVDQLLLPALLSLDKVQLVHSLANVGVLLGGRPQVITMHDLYQAWPIEDRPTGRTRLPQRLYKALFRAQCRRSQLLVTDAAHVAEEISTRLQYPRAQIRVIPLGLDRVFTDFISSRASAGPATQRRGEVADEAQTERDYILFFASSDPRKNLDRALAAWAALPAEYHQVPLLALSSHVGARRRVQASAKRHAERPLQLRKWVERADLPELYANAKVVFVPTLGEGFGLPAVEAHALGVPVVCGDVEFLSNKGVSEQVFRCDPRSEEAITEALLGALQLPSRSKKKPDGFADDIRTMAEVAREMLALYNEIGLRYMTKKP